MSVCTFIYKCSYLVTFYIFNIGIFEGIFNGILPGSVNKFDANVSTGDLSNCSLFESSNHCIQQVSEQN